MLNDTLKGLVVTLPTETGSGVVVDCTKQGKNLYKATVITDKADVMICQFKTSEAKPGEDIDYVDWRFYSPRNIAYLL